MPLHTVATLLYPGALATSVTLPMEILQAASQMASISRRAEPQVRCLLAAEKADTVDLASGISLTAQYTWHNLPPLDLLILPAIWRNPLPTVQTTTACFDYLRATAASGTRICSVGTGSFLLAEAGLLDNRVATTHWNYFDTFTRRYPRIALKTGHLITQSDNLYCVGSVNSIADLMVHIIEEWFGSRIARAVENQFSPEIRRRFRAAAYQNEADSSHHDEAIIEAQQCLQEHLNQPLTISQLASGLGMSSRTLNRRFRRATGMSPQAYLQSLRITTARDLLRHSNLTVGDIAWAVGLCDASYFSQLFKQHCGVNPLRYREAVRGKLFDPASALPSKAPPAGNVP